MQIVQKEAQKEALVRYAERAKTFRGRDDSKDVSFRPDHALAGDWGLLRREPDLEVNIYIFKKANIKKLDLFTCSSLSFSECLAL